MKLLMRLLGWKRLSRRRRVKLQGWKNTVKKAAAIITAAALTSVAIATVKVDNRVAIVLGSCTALSLMVAWLWYHMHKEWSL